MPNVQIDFNKVTKSGLKNISKMFSRRGLNISDISATNRPKRESGYPVKTAIFLFESGQKLFVKVKSDGAVFQVKLNNKALPIKNVDNLSKAIDEIATHVKANEKRYLKAQQKRLARQKIKIDQPKVVTTRKRKIEHAESRISELEAEAETLLQKIKQDEDALNVKQGQITDLEANLETLKTRGSELEAELKTVKRELEAA